MAPPVPRKRPAAATQVGDGMQAEEVPIDPVVLKRPAALASLLALVAEEEEEEVVKAPPIAPAEEQEEKKISEEEALASEDAARRKELNVMPAADLKRLLEIKGLTAKNKAAMVDALLTQEAKERAESRAHEKRIRDVMVSKLAELEALGAQELRERCTEMGVRGNATKEARVQLLLNKWQEEDGVDKALASLAQDARKQELQGKEPEALRQFCEELSVEPFVQEVMAERVVRKESALGRFARPVLEDLGVAGEVAVANPTTPRGGDMVEALLASESRRRQEKELRRQQEEEEAKKRADLNSMTLGDLRARITARGREPVGKKEDLVEILLEIAEQDEAAEARKAKVKAMPVEELKKLLQSKGLDLGGGRREMAEAWLAFEARAREEAKTYAGKVEEVLEERRRELEGRPAAELKDLCAGKCLKAGWRGSKEDLLQSLLEDLRGRSSEVDAIVASKARRARLQELLVTEREATVQLCKALGVSPFVKEIMVERIMLREAELSTTKLAAKRARTS